MIAFTGEIGSHLWLAVIDVEDFPDIDPSSEDGQEKLTSLAFALHRKFASITHVEFRRDGKEIGSAIFPPPDKELN